MCSPAHKRIHRNSEPFSRSRERFSELFRDSIEVVRSSRELGGFMSSGKLFEHIHMHEFDEEFLIGLKVF